MGGTKIISFKWKDRMKKVFVFALTIILLGTFLFAVDQPGAEDIVIFCIQPGCTSYSIESLHCSEGYIPASDRDSRSYLKYI